MRYVPSDRRWRDNDGVARLRRRHECVKIGEGTGGDTDLGIVGLENLAGQIGGDHLDFLNRLQTHLVFVTGIPERGARTQSAGEQGLSARVHDIGGRVQIETIAFMDGLVLRHQVFDACGKVRARPICGLSCDLLDTGEGGGGKPGIFFHDGHAVAPEVLGSVP